MNFELADYQQRAKQHVLDNKACALFMSMGMGKTLTVLDAANDLFEAGEIKGVLVLAPLRVSLLTWPAEIEKWFPSRTYCNLRDPKQLQRVLDGERFHYYLANFEALISRDVTRKGVRKHYAGLVEKLIWKNDDLPFDMVVFDELTKLKNPTSSTLKTLKPFLGTFARRVGLTGTPVPNSYLDLWSQIFAIDVGQRLGATYYNFRSRWFEADWSGYNWSLRPGAKETIDAKVAEVALTLRASDYLEVPDTDFIDIDVPLPPAARRQYAKLEKELLVLLEGDDTEIVALNGAVLAGKLLQICSGFIYDEERNVHCVHEARVKKLVKLVKSINEPVLIASVFRHEKEAILREVPGCVAWDDSILDDWNSGTIKAIVADPRSIGHGLNLQDGGSTVIWFSQNWSRETRDQFNERVCGVRALRSGKTPQVYSLLAPETIDSAVQETLRSKELTQSSLLSTLTNLQKLKR